MKNDKKLKNQQTEKPKSQGFFSQAVIRGLLASNKSEQKKGKQRHG